MSTYLVLGATGKTGRRIVKDLAAAGHAVRAASRAPAPAARGIAPVHFDWNDADTYDAALAGATGAYIVPPAYSLDHPPLIRAFVDRAVAAGVRRAVLLSARGVDADDSIPLRRAELAVEAASIRWTVLRPSWFAQNFTEGSFAPRDGVIAAPAGDAPTAFTDTQDIADVAVAALTDDAHAGQTYELSMPEALTWSHAAEILAREAGRPIAYADVEPDTWLRDAVAAGAPAPYMEMLAGLFALVRAGHEARTSDGVSRALGRPATSFAAWAAREARSPEVVAVGAASA